MLLKRSSNTSNSTPSELPKKIESAPKVVTIAGLQALAIVFVMAGLLFWWRDDQVQIKIGTATVQADIADTEEERANGLRDRLQLTDDQGMLFVFPHDARWQIWMKDMKVPIDIVWLDADKKVVGVQAQAMPDSYPGHFTPPADARYVLELASGVTQKARIAPGMRADFAVTPATK